jgi:hypothetical protein
MSKKASIGRFVAGAVLFGYLGLAVMQSANATSTIAQHGYWSSVVDTTDDGHRVCGVRTRMGGGGELRLAIVNDDVHLVARDDRWHMRVGDTSRVSISVDGRIFSGNAKAIDGQTLIVASLADDFVSRFIEGDEMLADFGGVRWDVSLEGSSRVTGEMAACAAFARSGLTS